MTCENCKVERTAREAIVRLKNIEIARLEKEFWYEKWNHASFRHDIAKKKLEQANAISQGVPYELVL